MNVPENVDGARPSPDTTIGSVVNAASRSKVLRTGLPVAEVEKRHAEIWRAVVARRQVEDPIGIGHRKAADRVCVQDREEHVVDANSESEDGNGRECEARCAPQQSDRQTQILQRSVDERQSPLVLVLFLDARDAAEGPSRRAPRLLFVQPEPHLLCGQQVQMCLNLFRQPLVTPTAQDEIECSREKYADGGHDSPSRRRLTIETVRAQSSVSDASWRRPDAVIE